MADNQYIEGLDRQIAALQAKDRDLKKERDRIERDLKDNRAKLWAVVDLKKDAVREPSQA